MTFKQHISINNQLYVGRASTAIFLILKANGIRGMRVLVPANICYAAVLPILYSGNHPVFVDVGADGNLTIEGVTSATFSNLSAAIVPHMYGNPCQDIRLICEHFKRGKILTIEDCSVAMGAEVNGSFAGDFGDYAVYSFGYSKTIDHRYGGLITSKLNLCSMEGFAEELEYYDDDIENETLLFSQLYRILKNHEDRSFIRKLYGEMFVTFRRCFLFRASSSHYLQLSNKLDELENIIDTRRRMTDIYIQNLNFSPGFGKYQFTQGSVPWRYNILVNPEYHTSLINFLLNRNVPVSNWYPVIARMFQAEGVYPVAYKMEKEIMNFPLLLEYREIKRICNAVNEFWENQPLREDKAG
jgi:dTDP-4-amino-4,6-dideoxygalactose transaminase